MEAIKILATTTIGLIWLVGDTIYTVKKTRNAIREANKDVHLIVKCEKCQNEHQATIEEEMSTWLSISVWKEKMVTFAGTSIGKKKFIYHAKKFYCPVCEKKTWSEIKNNNELAEKNLKIQLPYWIKYLIRGVILELICQIFF